MTSFAYRFDRHADTGWRTMRLSYIGAESQEWAMAQIAPDPGSNLVAFQVEGTDYLYAKPTGSPFLGTPVLYPTPNRVRNAQFSFGGRTFKFTANNGTNFLHGLVRDIPWVCDEPVVASDRVSVAMRASFQPGSRIYDLFPIRNTLEITYTLQPKSVRLDFSVHNEDEQPLPFGLAIHPYFPIHGPRSSVRLQVPAKAWMEAVDLLPTGKLVDMDKGPADLRQPTSLEQLALDDVFWGLKPDAPQVIFYDSIGRKVTLSASALFTHSVVYTPQGRPYFCVENQSCSTDAHNLYARGLEKEAHLMILPPGETHKAWVEISVSDQ
jgi:aldose 1-epimerase